MKRTTTIKINDEISVKRVHKAKKAKTSVFENGKEIVLATIETGPYFWSRMLFDENYIVVYSRGCMINQIPLTVEAVYSIKEKRVLTLNQKLRTILDYMLICRRGVDLTDVLTTINNEELGLVDSESKGDLTRYLTAENDAISREEVVEYVLKAYPILKAYTNLKGPISVIQYKKIKEEIGTETFWFHIMSQNISRFERSPSDDTHVECNRHRTNYAEIYVSEYEQAKKQ